MHYGYFLLAFAIYVEVKPGDSGLLQPRDWVGTGDNSSSGFEKFRFAKGIDSQLTYESASSSLSRARHPLTDPPARHPHLLHL